MWSLNFWPHRLFTPRGLEFEGPFLAFGGKDKNRVLISQKNKSYEKTTSRRSRADDAPLHMAVRRYDEQTNLERFMWSVITGHYAKVLVPDSAGAGESRVTATSSLA